MATSKPFGLVHERRLFVSHDGSESRGEDTLVAARRGNARRAASPSASICIPTVKVTRDADGRAAILTLPSGATWRFGTDAQLEIADSVYLAAGDAIRKTHQIVISGATGGRTGRRQMGDQTRRDCEPDPPVN